MPLNRLSSQRAVTEYGVLRFPEAIIAQFLRQADL
jgi:hypothetical protein